jgi:hypothetical protein
MTAEEELITKVALAISGSGVVSPASLRKARAAVDVARPIIEREILEKMGTSATVSVKHSPRAQPLPEVP